MEHSFRCTNCTWRGTREDANGRSGLLPIDESVARIQLGYDEHQAQPPTCPVCGQHTMKVHLHRRKAAV